MAQIIRTEKRKRGFFGKLFLILFILFNILMVVFFVANFVHTAEMMDSATNDWEKAGTALGHRMVVNEIMSYWVVGVIVLGIPVLLTRGKKIITERHVA